MTLRRNKLYISDVKYHKYRSAIVKFRTSAHTFPVEKGKWQSIPRDQRLCLLCLDNLIGDEKHYIFHCTNDKLVDTRKDFVRNCMKVIYSHALMIQNLLE